MAETKTEVGVEISIQTKQAQQQVNALTKEVDALREAYKNAAEGSEEQKEALDKLTKKEKELEKANDKLNKSLKENQDAAKKSEKSNKGLLETLKAFSIVGAVVSGFNFLKDSLLQNQKVANQVEAVFTTINNTISAFVEVVINSTKKVGEQTNGFDALFKVLKGGLVLAITPLRAAFNGISLAIDEIRLAWEESPFGDKDQETIKNLTKRIEDSKLALIDTAKNAKNAASDIYNNFGEAVSETGQLISDVVDNASKINVKSIYENAKATIQLKNTAKIAIAELNGIKEKYDRLAEVQRQIRDDDRNSIQDRIAANVRLGEILEEQKKIQISLADQRVAAAASELKGNKENIELQVAYKEALNERAAILATIAGLESEQLANTSALDKELIELNKSKIEGEQTLAIERRKANADLITDELAKNIELQKIRDEERQSELERLQDNINKYKEGTQSRVDAEIEFNRKKQELDIADEVAQKERAKIIRQRSIDETSARLENELAVFNNKKALIDLERISAFEKTQRIVELAKQEAKVQIEQLNLKRDAEILAAEQAGLSTVQIKEKYSQQEIAINNAVAKSEKELAIAKKNATIEAADAIASTLQSTAQLLGENTAVGKALAVASTTISSITAAQKAYEAAQSLPFGIGSVLGPINAALAIATGVANVRKILAVKVPGSSGVGGALPTNTNVGRISAPLQPQLATTTLNQGQINQLSSATNRSFVLETDVSGNQERIRRINRAARIN